MRGPVLQHCVGRPAALRMDSGACQDAAMSRLLFTARSYMHELHVLAEQLKRREAGARSSAPPPLRTVLDLVSSLHSLVAEHLMAWDAAQPDRRPPRPAPPQPEQQPCAAGREPPPAAAAAAEEAAAFAASLARWHAAAAQAGVGLVGTPDQHQQRRQQQLQQELAAAAAAAEQLGLDPRRQQLLQQVIAGLRALEETPSFQGRLLRGAAACSAATGYSRECFAYASTPFASWCEVLRHPTVAAAAAAAMAPRGRCCTVWGSSTGWLLWYGALAFDWQCHGVELLPQLVEAATDVAARHGLAGRVQCSCCDLLEDSVSATGLLLMADQCWDDALQDKAARKASAELPSPALVISYRGSRLRPLFGARLQRTVELTAPVSWNAQQQWSVFLLQ